MTQNSEKTIETQQQFAPPWVSVMVTPEGTYITAPGVDLLLPGKWGEFDQNLLFQALRPAQQAVRRG